MKRPLVSVIIPAYNAKKTILRTLQSALNQTYSPIEIIVVNDGSTDTTLEVVRSIKDKRIRVYSQSNKGPSAARNYGAKKAKGEYLSFLDADDLWDKDKIKIEMGLLKDSSKTALFSGVAVIHRDKIIKKYSLKEITFQQLQLCNYAVCGSNLTIKKATFLDYKYDENTCVGEDYALILDLVQDNCIIVCPKILVYYCIAYTYFPDRFLMSSYTGLKRAFRNTNYFYSYFYLNLYYMYLYNGKFKFSYLFYSLFNSPVYFFKRGLLWIKNH